MDIEFLLSKPKGRCNARYVKKNYPEEYNKIILLKGDTFSERLYNYIYNSPTHICPVCGKETRDAWNAVKEEIAKKEPLMAAVMVLNCIYRGFCPEPKSCGYWKTNDFKLKLNKYRSLINRGDSN